MEYDYLFLIEAPGKRKTVDHFLKKNGIRAITLTTSGFFWRYNCGLEDLNITSKFKEVGRLPDKKTVEILSGALEKCKSIVIATDNDSEGHAIGWDIYRTFAQFKKPFHRLTFSDLSEETLITAFKNMKEINKKDLFINAKEGITRRIIDRLIGHIGVKTNVRSGRVFTPLLHQLSQNNLKDLYDFSAVIASNDDNGFYRGEAQFSVKQVDLFEKVCPRAISSLKKELISPSPWTFSDLILQTQKNSRYTHSVDRIEMAVQHLYESGDITYPRTNNHFFSSSAADAIKEMASFHRARFDLSKLPVTNDFSANAHGAISLTKKGMKKVDKSVKNDFACLETLIVNGIYNQIASCLQDEYIEIGAVLEKDKKHEIVEKLRYKKESSRVVQASNKSDKIPFDHQVMLRMAETGLGKPSTYINHTTKILEPRLITQEGKLTYHALKTLEGTEKNWPVLLKAETAKSLENLFSQKEKPFGKIILEALECLEIDKKSAESLFTENSLEMSF